ncbi:MAG: sigma-54 dependent transcriptional regulator [Candidatus Sumerlaeaceae bacterium]|nr:sigma-54 dependent transcriptional regulator [Candidatus Sumerlaeaceae bacterium]
MSETAANRAAHGAHVVVIDDEEGMCTILRKVLSQAGFRVDTYTQPQEALAHLRELPPDVVVTDLKMPGGNGLEVLRTVRQVSPTTNVIIMTAYATVESAIQAMRDGAYDYITKPFKLDELLLVVERAAERTRLKEENEALTRTLTRSYEVMELVGESAPMRELRSLIAKVAPTDAAVLIRGESGTGKELVARAIHRQSNRARAPFVAINCASIPETLLESELFGYEKGAFTGADRPKLGLVEVANGGTLFLDEIGDLPLALQAKVLRMLQEHEIQRVGGLRPISVDVRLIAATNRDLEEAMRERLFRADLFYRLNVISISLPPLRERREDIPILIEHFASKAARKLSRNVPTFGAEALAALERYPFPGNVRELENLVERLLILCEKETIGLEDLPADVRAHGRSTTPVSVQSWKNVADLDYRQAREQFEREYFRRLIEATRGNVSEAARLSGISRRHLYEKFERLGIRVPSRGED